VGTVQNISADPRTVPLLDRNVAVNETVTVDDALLDPASRSWDPVVWLIVPTP
jgi:hypothetical protein